MSVVMLIEGSQGDTVAVQFTGYTAARKFEDAHPELTVRGVVPVVPRRDLSMWAKRFWGEDAGQN